MTDSSPITRDEMIEMFGDAMPIEAVNLIWNGPPGMSVGECRVKLREIAANRKAEPRLAPDGINLARQWLASHLMAPIPIEISDTIERALELAMENCLSQQERKTP